MDEKKTALIIGNSEYDDPLLRQLVAPSRDAATLAEVLADSAIGGFDVHQLINTPSHKVCEEIEGFFDDRDRDHLLLLYFSGHGITDDDGMLYYATSNTHHKRMRSTAVAANWVNDVMTQCRSRRQVLLLDCCHSGAFARTKAAISANAGLHLGGRTPEEGRGRFVLTASDAFQYSFEGEAVQGQGVRSVFTEALVEGLRTGHADLDGDGLITLDELYSYVHGRMKDRMPQQSPRKWESDVEGSLVIAFNPRPKEAPLPEDLQNAIENLIPEARQRAIPRLEKLMRAKHRGLALAALNALRMLAQDDSRRVSQAALKSVAEYERGLTAEKREAPRVRVEKQIAVEANFTPSHPLGQQQPSSVSPLARATGAAGDSTVRRSPTPLASATAVVKPTDVEKPVAQMTLAALVKPTPTVTPATVASKAHLVTGLEAVQPRPSAAPSATPAQPQQNTHGTKNWFELRRNRSVLASVSLALLAVLLGIGGYRWLENHRAATRADSSQASVAAPDATTAPLKIEPLLTRNPQPSDPTPNGEVGGAAGGPLSTPLPSAASTPPRKGEEVDSSASSGGATATLGAVSGRDSMPRDSTDKTSGKTRESGGGSPPARTLAHPVLVPVPKSLTIDEMVQRGDLMRLAKNYADATRIYRPAAEQGNAHAQNALGLFYQNGLGVTKDDEQAAQWYRKAADQGYAAAQLNLGALYKAGAGVHMDYVQAAQWYRRAAEQEVPKAQSELSIMYQNGWGVARNADQAQYWLQKAAANGYPATKQ